MRAVLFCWGLLQLLGGLGVTVNSAILPPGVNSQLFASETNGSSGPYSTVFWPTTIDSSLDVDYNIPSYYVGSNGTLGMAGAVNIISTYGGGILVTAPGAQWPTSSGAQASFNYSIGNNTYILDPGFGGAGCVSYTVQTSSAAVAVSLQDQQGFVFNTPTAVANISLQCYADQCNATGVLGLNASNSYLFLMNNTSPSTGWAALGHQFLAVNDPACQAATQTVPNGAQFTIDANGGRNLAIGMLHQPTQIFYAQFPGQFPPPNQPGWWFLVGGYWNARCFSAALQTFAPYGAPAASVNFYAFDFHNFQNFFVGYRATPIVSCSAGAAGASDTCQISSTLTTSTAIFLVATYSPVSNANQIDYVWETLTAVYSTGAECSSAPQNSTTNSLDLLHGTAASSPSASPSAAPAQSPQSTTGR